MRTTIDRAGRLVIPKAIREQAGYRPGLEMEIEYRDGRVEIQAVSKVRLVRKGSFLVGTVPRKYMKPPLTNEQVNKIIRDLRERRKQW